MHGTGKTGEAAAQRCFVQAEGNYCSENRVPGVTLGSSSVNELSRAHGNAQERQIVSVNFGLDL